MVSAAVGNDSKGIAFGKWLSVREHLLLARERENSCPWMCWSYPRRDSCLRSLQTRVWEFGDKGLLPLSIGVDRTVGIQSKFYLFGSWKKLYKLKFCRLVKSASEGENVVPIPRNSQTVWNSKFRNNMENSSYRRGDCSCFPDRRLEGYVYKKGIQYFFGEACRYNQAARRISDLDY